MNSLKKLIIEKSNAQKDLKNQRKTVNLVGERTLNPRQAYLDHYRNRWQLRQLFIAYAILRGKDPVKAVPNYGKLDKRLNWWEQEKVKELVDQYQSEFINDEAVRTEQ